MGLNTIDERDLLEAINKWFSERKIYNFGFSVSKVSGQNIQYSETAVGELEQENAELKDDIEELESDVDCLEDQVNDLESERDNLLKKVAELEKKIEEEAK